MSSAADSGAAADARKLEKLAANEAKKNLKLERFRAKQSKLQETAASAPAADPAAATAAATAAFAAAASAATASTAAPVSASATNAPDLSAYADDELNAALDPCERVRRHLGKPMPDTYLPAVVERVWSDWWETHGFFKPSAANEETYVIPIPPPNVTGSLHLGHALTVAIQDTLVRWNRMRGKVALYVPGCDHAGIATQSIVEKRLWKEKKLTRHDLGREPFLEKVWEWKEMYGSRIYNQIRTLGTSCDWSRACFTMDPKLSKAVTESFVRLHREGVIYRATRLVNWCSHLNTALSNLEVYSKELTERTLLTVPGLSRKVEFGVIVLFAYEIEDSDDKEHIVVATTRVETMLGDTAIAVNPTDARYSNFVGKHAIHPLIPGRKLLIVADTYVDVNFGTGAVKITPAHDTNDFELAQRHKISAINILNDNGTLNENAGPKFAGMHRFEARYKVVEALKELGLYRETRSHAMAVPICSRSGDIIEPRMKPQWWVRCREMADAAMEAVRNKSLEILPVSSEKEWFHWLENIQDWCISRQLWWGHRVPAYRLVFKDFKPSDVCDERWVSGRTVDEAREFAKKQFPGQEFTLEQDEDVLDTWFSSGLWPFSIFGWPDSSADLEKFYPAALLETGWDILFFWVARMVMLGIKLTGKVPFKQVFCHAMVRDAHGRKMSKSLGNVIDPADVISGITLENMQTRLLEGNLDQREVDRASAGLKTDFPKGISECGADALRFAMCAYTSFNRDINLDIQRVEGYRKFCNKVWNAVRFAMMRFGKDFVPLGEEEFCLLPESSSPAEYWIIARLAAAAAAVNESLETMNFMAATTAAHSFWLHELCDVYLEAAKVIDTPTSLQTLRLCIDMGLRMLHPFMPFVTETLWQRLPRSKTVFAMRGLAAESPASIMVTRYPCGRKTAALIENKRGNADGIFSTVNEIARALRVLVKEYNLPASAKCTLYVDGVSTPDDVTGFTACFAALRALVRSGVGEIVLGKIGAGCAMLNLGATASAAGLVAGLHVVGSVDIGAEITKTQDKLDKILKSQQQLSKQMNAGGYLERVKPDVHKINEAKKQTLETTIEELTRSLEGFKLLKEDD